MNSQYDEKFSQNQDFQSIYSDDQEPMSNRDLMRLSNLWKKMKQNKKNINLSDQSAALNYMLSSAENSQKLQQNQQFLGSKFLQQNNNNFSQSRNQELTNSQSQNSQNKHQNAGKIIQKSTQNFQNTYQQQMHQLQQDLLQGSLLSQSQKSPKISNLTTKNEEKKYSQKPNQQQQQKQQIQQQLQLQSNSDSKKLQTKLQDALGEIEKCHEKIANLLTINNTQQQELQLLQTDLQIQQNSTQKQLEFAEKQELSHLQLTQQLAQKDQKIAKLTENYTQIELQFQELLEKNQKLLQNLENQKQITQEKIQENARIQQKLTQTEKDLDKIFLEKQTKGTILLEIEYLKGDVERLLNLLKNTKEFQNFAQFAENSQNQIRFLQKMPQILNQQYQQQLQLQQKQGQKNSHFQTTNFFNNKVCATCKSSDFSQNLPEKLFWIPQDAYSLFYKIKEKNQGEFNQIAIEEILFGLSLIFQEREKKNYAQEKNKLLQEIQNLKKALNKHMGFSELTFKKQVSRLKQQLSKAKTQLKQAKLNQQNNNLNSQQQFDQNYQIKLYQEHLENKDQIIQNLQKKIQQLQTDNIEQVNAEKIFYLDGAIWMADKQIEKTIDFQNQLGNFILEFNQQFEKLIETNKFAPDSIFIIYQNLIESIEQSLKSAIQSQKLMKESVSKNQNDFNTQRDQSSQLSEQSDYQDSLYQKQNNADIY